MSISIDEPCKIANKHLEIKHIQNICLPIQHVLHNVIIIPVLSERHDSNPALKLGSYVYFV